MKLNELSDQPGATQNRKRVGRGVGSGSGKTAGRGQKGQKSRGGVALNGFEGGQMPLYMRLPKRGFTKRNRAEFAEINLSNLAAAIEAGKIDPKDVTEDSLVKSGVVRRVKSGVRVLARGEAPKKLNITVTGASKAAVEAIEKAGGKITLTGKKAEAEAGDNA